jgi:hypothetical protein
MAAHLETLFIHPNRTTDTAIVNLPSPSDFLAWCSIIWINPRTKPFGVGDAIGVDIPFIAATAESSFLHTEEVLSGGILGDPGESTNLRQSALDSSGQRILFRLRSFPQSDGELACVANCIVITNP